MIEIRPARIKGTLRMTIIQKGERMSDLISRQALLAEYDRLHVGEPGRARKMIEDAPSAAIEEKDIALIWGEA